MPEKKSLGDKIGNWIFSIPFVLQYWAKKQSRQSEAVLKDAQSIPFARLKKPLKDCRFSLITTGGIHLPDQPPFDMENPDGDASYRIIPGEVDTSEIVITHKYYNHTDADRDVNIIFPLDRFRKLKERGVIGDIAPRHFGFMGHIEGAQLPLLNEKTAPEVARMLIEDQVDVAFLTPA